MAITKEQKAALDPFQRVLFVIEALPTKIRPADSVGLASTFPGVWPNMGDLRALVAAFKE